VSRKRYQAIVEDIPAMICRFLPDGKLTFLNNEYARYFQGNTQEMVGQNFFHHLPEDERELVQIHFSSLSLKKPLITYTQELQAQGGHSYWQQWTGRALFNEQGKLTEYQALGRDISDEIRAQEEKVELEKQLQTSKKMEAIGTLAGGIAHDFNNILGGMIGYTELAQDEISPDSRSQHYLQQILKACHRAKELVIQILIFSRQGPTERQPLQIESLVKETLKLLKVNLANNIEIRYQSSAFDGTILANPTQIHQTLMNLYTNATHAMRETGGFLEVDVQEIDITEDKPTLFQGLQAGSYIKLSIGDSGPGMEQELLQRVFDPYFSTKTPYEGTGLGLSICLGIVENHGGTIGVESSQGEGSTFTIMFPKVQATPELEQESKKPEVPAAQGHERILFVDDEAFLVDIGQDMLKKLGYQIVTARNGLEALELFQAQAEAFDLVITDQTMPKMTGAELTEKLLELREDIPIILCTGFSESITEEQAKSLGIREFILKPISRQGMAQAIRKVLD
ncbi:MAG: response regulator, partial [bacterium]|nr:response regulator [bacterium]